MQSDIDGAATQHAGDDTLELYSLGTLPESAAGPLEEHLLICESCRRRLEETDDYVQAIRLAAAKLRREPPSPWRVFVAKPGWAAAAVLAVAVWVTRGWVLPAPPVPVTLQAVRGSGAPLAHAPAGKRLTLQMDVADVSQRPCCLIEIVDERGNLLWEGRGAARGVRLVVDTGLSLREGRYWVRLYEPGPLKDLLREFGLEVKAER